MAAYTVHALAEEPSDVAFLLAQRLRIHVGPDLIAKIYVADSTWR